MSESLVSVDRIHQAILILRDQKVILDRDLAVLYGVPTRVLKQYVSPPARGRGLKLSGASL